MHILNSIVIAFAIGTCAVIAGPASSAPLADDAALTTLQRDRLVAVARLAGIVRHFHPSDAAADLDWNALTVAMLRDLDLAGSDAEFAGSLERWFRPIAPTIYEPLTLGDVADDHHDPSLRIVTWEHHGCGQVVDPARSFSIYRSKRQFRSLGDSVKDGETAPPTPADVAMVHASDDLTWRVPLAVYGRDGATLPVSDEPFELPAKGDGDDAGGPPTFDRATRFAAVILLWNVMQHFYPYFDVVDADWDAVLAEALSQAAVTSDGRSFEKTLRWMVAELDDGHGYVGHPQFGPSWQMPLDWTWVGDKLVVTHVPDETLTALRAGDVVESLDGVPTTAVYADVSRYISAATEGWRRHQALQQMRMSKEQVVFVEFRRPDGTVVSSRQERVNFRTSFSEPRGEKVREFEDGVIYVDLDRMSDRDWPELVVRLAAAPGVIFDLRGYPQCRPQFLYHLAREPVKSANWNVPVVRWPDRDRWNFNTSSWTPAKVNPHIGGAIAFVTDGRAISYAESCMAIVEHYRLGEIIGAPTAGTNGNVNSFELPGGFLMAWTGMKVTTHDDAQFHGVGVEPTIPAGRTVEGIAAGRDEVLERARMWMTTAIAESAAPDHPGEIDR
jgi:C-terminal processing protease CtpA/Prc